MAYKVHYRRLIAFYLVTDTSHSVLATKGGEYFDDRIFIERINLKKKIEKNLYFHELIVLFLINGNICVCL